MNLRNLKDAELLSEIKKYVQSERDHLVKILHHLREIEMRRLFCDLGYKSLFDYALGELHYSEGQASRRIQSMRLMKDIPEVEAKIADGSLSLSNVQQAQTFFREVQLAEPLRALPKEEKLNVLAKLENKSMRDGQKELLKMQPQLAIPKERERQVTETSSEVRFVMSDKLKAKLEEVRSLLGTKGAAMSYAELFEVMSDLSIELIRAKKFGKKRTQKIKENVGAQVAPKVVPKKQTSAPAAAVSSEKQADQRNPRYIPQALKYQVWQRDNGRCVSCQSTRHLNYDHIKPVGLGGLSTLENLRLLCFQCNQRASAKVFGEWVKSA